LINNPKRVSADGPGRGLEPGQVVKRPLIGRLTGTLRETRNDGGERMESGRSRPDDRTRGGQGRKKKRYTPRPHVCGAEKSLERANLCVSGHCADNVFLTQTRNGYSPTTITHPFARRRGCGIKVCVFLRFVALRRTAAGPGEGGVQPSRGGGDSEWSCAVLCDYCANR
jgi:hypothetical protein